MFVLGGLQADSYPGVGSPGQECGGWVLTGIK